MRILNMILAIVILCAPLFSQNENTQNGSDQQEKAVRKISSKEIIVTGKRDQPGVVTVISEKDVKESPKTNLVDVVKENVPSFYTPNNRVMGFGVSNSGAASMSIRGVGISGWGPTTGVPFLINGLDTTTSIMGHPIADIFTMKNIDRIEVLHGAQPVLYGSGALGGVINIITKRQETGGFLTELSASYGRYNTTDDYVIHQGKIGIFDYGISYNFQRTDGAREQTTPNGSDATSEYMNQSGTARFGFELGENWYAGLNAYVMKQIIDDPGPDGAPTNNLETFDILRDGISLNVLNEYRNFDGMLHIFYNDGHHEAERTAINTDAYEHDDALYGIHAVESATFFEGNRITAGIDVRKWGGSSKILTNNTINEEKFLRDASVFGVIEQRFYNAFTLSGGARHTDNSKYGGFTAWQGGAIINPLSWFKIHSSIAEGFKLPDLRQVYVKMYPVDVPNENLEAETYTSYDAGIELTLFEYLVMDFTGYRIYSENKIIRSGNTWDNADDFNYNGAEVSARYLIMQMIGLKGGYSYIDNEYDDQKLPYVPKHKFNGGVTFEKWGFFAGLECEVVRDVYSDSDGTDRLSDYTVFNGKLSYQFLERYRVFINLSNIGNKDYETYSDYPMPGFTYLAGLTVTL